MKESKLIEMHNKVEATGRVLQTLINKINHLETLTMGNHQVLKRMDGFSDIIEQLKEETADESEQQDSE